MKAADYSRADQDKGEEKRISKKKNEAKERKRI